MNDDLSHFLAVASPWELAAFASLPGLPLEPWAAKRARRAMEILGRQIAGENEKAAERAARQARMREELIEIWQNVALPDPVAQAADARRKKRSALQKRVEARRKAADRRRAA